MLRCSILDLRRPNVARYADEIRDARAARSAGIAFGAVGWGYHALEALRAERPAEVFERVADLSRLASSGGRGLRASS